MYFTLQYIRLRACLKNAFRKAGYVDCGNDFSNTL